VPHISKLTTLNRTVNFKGV